MSHQEFIFTKDNLIANLDKLGAWSAYTLAQDYLRHNFPDEYSDDGEDPPIEREVEMLVELGCECWQDAIEKHAKEVGYNPEGGVFNPAIVNQY